MQRVDILKDEIKIGYWVTFCCCHDGYEISSKEELKELLQNIEDMKEDDDFECLKPSIFKTVEDFLNAVCIC